MDVRLDGRTALITGASEGLGLAMARKFAESGANVAMVSRNAEKLEAGRQSVLSSLGGNTVKVEAIPCDVSRADTIAEGWAKVTDAFGNIDILVNNAGATAIGPFLSHSDEVWQADLDLKLFAAIRLCRLAMPGMARPGLGWAGPGRARALRRAGPGPGRPAGRPGSILHQS